MIDLDTLLETLADWFEAGEDGTGASPDPRPGLRRLEQGFPGALGPLLFDAAWYAARHGLPSRGRKAAAKVLAHFRSTGTAKGFDPNPWFSEQFYRLSYPDVRAEIAAGRWVSGFHHYLARGMAEHRSPDAAFNELAYLGSYPDVLAFVREGMIPSGRLHYALWGVPEGRPAGSVAAPPSSPRLPVLPGASRVAPSPAFAEAAYRNANPDVGDDGLPSPGSRHWLAHGLHEDLAGLRGRIAGFVENVYNRENPDIGSVLGTDAMPTGYHHFLSYGVSEGRRWAGGMNGAAAHAVMTAALVERTEPPPEAESWPMISVIVPVYDPNTAEVLACIDSVRRQTYGRWQLCLADDGSPRPETAELLLAAAAADPRISVVFAGRNGGISAASNAALTQARGEFVALLDNDDVLAPDALLHVARAAAAADVDVIYTDEGKLNERGEVVDLYAKPGWSPELLLSTMYIGHLTTYRRAVVEAVGGFRSQADGTQDYDLALRVAEVARGVVHIPLPLYFWRMSATSTAASLDAKPGVLEAQKRALRGALLRRGLRGSIGPGHHRGFWRVELDVPAPAPLVSVVIPTAGQAATIGGATFDLVDHCVRSLVATETYPNVEYVVVHNGDLRAETLRTLAGLKGVRLVHYAAERFNLSDKINQGVREAAGEFVLLLNDDMQAASEGIVRSMMGCMFDGVGVVGGQLLYANGTLQHAGIVWTADGPSHAMIGEQRMIPGPAERLKILHNCFGVSGACMFFRRDVFLRLGGYAPHLPTNYNDVEFCLKLRQDGLRVVFNPRVSMFHFESLSKAGTFFWELQLLLLGFPELSDPYVSRLFSPRSPFFEVVDPADRSPPGYRAWIVGRIDARRHLRSAARAIRFSFILSVYETPAPFLRELEATLVHQTYPNWELVLVDNGCRNEATVAWIDRMREHPAVVFVRLDENAGIMGGYGRAFRAATGDYVVPIDSDDLITLDCLDVLAHFLETSGMPDAVYSDEDKVDSRSNMHSPFLKPDWDPVLFTNICFVCHVCAIRRALAVEIGAYSDDAASGCHDWDTFLRLLRAGATVRHVPEVLYSWRIHAGSTASIETGNKPYTINSQKHVLDQHLRLTGADRSLVVVENELFPHNGMWRLAAAAGKAAPAALLLLPPPGRAAMADLLDLLVRGWEPDQRLMVIDPSPEVSAFLDDQPAEFAALLWPAALWPNGAAAARTSLEDAVSLCEAENRIVAVLDGSAVAGLNDRWLSEGLTMFDAAPDVELVGGQVRLPDGAVAWRGGFAGFGGGAGAPDYGRSAADSGYHGTGWCQRSCDAVPAVCFLSRPALLREALARSGGGRAGLRHLVGQAAVLARSKGSRIVYTPFMEAVLARRVSVEPILPATPSAPDRPRFYHGAFSHKVGQAYVLPDPRAGLGRRLSLEDAGSMGFSSGL